MSKYVNFKEKRTILMAFFFYFLSPEDWMQYTLLHGKGQEMTYSSSWIVGFQ